MFRFRSAAVAAAFSASLSTLAGCVDEQAALKLYGATAENADGDAVALSDSVDEPVDIQAVDSADLGDEQSLDEVETTTADVPDIAVDSGPEVDVLEIDSGPDGTADAAADGPETVADVPDVGPDSGPLNPDCPKAGPNASCGDFTCSPGENPSCCPVDCCGSCGDGKCINYACEEGIVGSKNFCAKDCAEACGDGKCNPGETPIECPKDCSETACGNAVCSVGETPQNCAADCGKGCGNCLCEPVESFDTCPVDCGSCGDGFAATANRPTAKRKMPRPAPRTASRSAGT